MNSNRSAEDNGGNIRGGWYNTRRQYRSVAFGTWKVGGARDLSIKRDVSEVKGQSTRSLETNRHHSTTTTNRFSMPKSINFGIPMNYGRNFDIDTVVPVRHENTIRMDRYRREGTPGSKSSKSVNISELGINNRKGKNLNELTNIRENIGLYKNQTLNRSYGSLSQRKKDRIATNVQKVHQRSRSVGNDNHISFCLLPCKLSFNNMSTTRYNNHSGYDGDSTDNSNNGNNGLLNPFKATKKFFKKIYDTATLPGRLHSKLLASNVIEPNEIPTTSLSSERSFIDASYSLELPDDEQNYQFDNFHYDHNIINQDATNSCTVANNDSDSAPSMMKPMMLNDDTMNDSGLSRSISSNDSQKTSYGDFRSWNDVFNHLKREMAYMRQRDAQILADLQFVELELRNVKNHQTMIKSNYAMRNNNNNNNNRINISNSNNGQIFDKRQIKLGDLVESIPL